MFISNSLPRALVAYCVVVGVAFSLLYLVARVRAWPAFVVAAIAGQVSINTVLFPTRIDYWSEFDSFAGLYNLIQIFTPIAVVVFAVVAAMSKRR